MRSQRAKLEHKTNDKGTVCLINADKMEVQHSRLCNLRSSDPKVEENPSILSKSPFWAWIMFKGASTAAEGFHFSCSLF